MHTKEAIVMKERKECVGKELCIPRSQLAHRLPLLSGLARPHTPLEVFLVH